MEISSRCNDFPHAPVRGKYDKFSLDMLVTLATRAGKHVELAVS